jgi:hypothetical protein
MKVKQFSVAEIWEAYKKLEIKKKGFSSRNMGKK